MALQERRLWRSQGLPLLTESMSSHPRVCIPRHAHGTLSSCLRRPPRFRTGSICSITFDYLKMCPVMSAPRSRRPPHFVIYLYMRHIRSCVLCPSLDANSLFRTIYTVAWSVR